MVLLVLTIAVVNLGVGFALAVYLEPLDSPQAPAGPMPTARQLAASSAGSGAAASAVQTVKDAVENDPVIEISDQWKEVLEQDHAAAAEFVTASIEVLRLEVGHYRERLIGIDDRVRICWAAPTQETVSELLAELSAVNHAWMEQQAAAASQLRGRAGTLGEFEEFANNLNEVLLEQAAQIETTCSNIEMLDFKTDLTAGCRRLIGEIRKLVDLAHGLRDRMLESLLAIARAEGNLESLDRKLQKDGLTGLLNRAGLEVVFHELWKEDRSRKRRISCGMLNIDRFGRLVEAQGAIPCDQLLTSFAAMLDDMLRKDRGFDLIVRFSGQCFVSFFADTGPRAATSAVERFRQTIAASQFELGDETLELSVSCGVTEVLPDDTTETLYKRLEATVRTAKRAGRNRTYLDEGQGPSPVDPPEYEVRPQIIRVADA